MIRICDYIEIKSPHRVEFWLFSLKLKVFAFFFFPPLNK